MKNGLIGILVFALVVESIFLVRRQPGDTDPPEGAPVSVRDAEKESNQAELDLQAENERLRRRMAELQRERDDSETLSETGPEVEIVHEPEPALSRMRTVTDLDDRGVVSVGMRFLNDSGGISDGVIELFELEPEEVESIGEAVDRTRAELRQLTEENSTVSTDDEGNLVITTEPFIEDGASIHDDLLESMEMTLGEERHRSLLRLVGESFERDFERFGANLQTVTISSGEGADGRNNLSVKTRQETGMSTSTHTRSFADREQILDEYPNLRNVMPEDIYSGESP